jgi:hypothetical protein
MNPENSGQQENASAPTSRREPATAEVGALVLHEACWAMIIMLRVIHRPSAAQYLKIVFE